ncbi:transcriptional regulator [Arenibacter sp. M-2]|uniref:transcriptional regulator n=1 Tax=Arenibacter sp. M-2 TaxID=3053612 RepID=UPI002570B726|nr:transcriptional regulator [Arenibacter sp. M-2]MDL5513242.1 transcriptional regulator [Arenibacter sp. M-2]
MDKLSKSICSYIAQNWIEESKSQRSFALDHAIDEKTVRRIKSDPDYIISLVTLKKICDGRNIRLSEFLELLGY